MHLVSYCFTKWCGGLIVKTLVWNQRYQGSTPLPTYIMWNMYIHKYILYICVNV